MAKHISLKSQIRSVFLKVPNTVCQSGYSEDPNCGFTTNKQAVNLHRVVNANDDGQPLLLNLLSLQYERTTGCQRCLLLHMKQLTSTQETSQEWTQVEKNGYPIKTPKPERYQPIHKIKTQQTLETPNKIIHNELWLFWIAGFVMCELFTFKGSRYIAPIRKQILIFIFALLECILFFRNKRGEEWAVGRLIRSVKSSPEILPQIANEGKNRRKFRQSTQDGMMCSRVYPNDMLCVWDTPVPILIRLRGCSSPVAQDGSHFLLGPFLYSCYDIMSFITIFYYSFPWYKSQVVREKTCYMKTHFVVH